MEPVHSVSDVFPCNNYIYNFSEPLRNIWLSHLRELTNNFYLFSTRRGIPRDPRRRLKENTKKKVEDPREYAGEIITSEMQLLFELEQKTNQPNSRMPEWFIIHKILRET